MNEQGTQTKVVLISKYFFPQSSDPVFKLGYKTFQSPLILSIQQAVLQNRTPNPQLVSQRIMWTQRFDTDAKTVWSN